MQSSVTEPLFPWNRNVHILLPKKFIRYLYFDAFAKVIIDVFAFSFPENYGTFSKSKVGDNSYFSNILKNKPWFFITWKNVLIQRTYFICTDVVEGIVKSILHKHSSEEAVTFLFCMNSKLIYFNHENKITNLLTNPFTSG